MTLRQLISAFLLGLLLVLRASSGPLPVGEGQLEPKGSARIMWVNGRIELQSEGTQAWDLAGWRVLVADVTNLSSDRQLRLTMHVASGSREAKTLRRANTGIALNPGETRAMRLLLPHRKLHAATKGVPGPRVLDTEAIHSIEFHMQWPFEGRQTALLHCRVANLRVEEPVGDQQAVAEGEAYFPFVDEFGQFVHGDWPEKVHEARELQERHAAELRELAAATRPAEWDRFGGWRNGPQLQATGSFRTEKYEGKWYLVDPERRLFFSLGLDVLHPHTDATPTAKHERWFQSPIPESGVLDFTHRSLRLKYGKEDYGAEFYETLARRPEHWGFNSIGDWGNSKLMALGRTAYTLQLTDCNRKLPRLKGSKLEFYDVFDPAYVEAMRNLVKTAAARDPQVTVSLTDPMCIGYFIDNELDFGNRGRQALGDDVLRCPVTQTAKMELCADLRTKYGEIGKLNAAWETDYADWDALLAGTTVPKSKGYKVDSDVFLGRAVDQYFRLCREAVKSAAPHRLYLGCRFISTDAVRRALYEAAGNYCDVLSTNVYAHSVANLSAPGFPDMPVLVGEFHLGVYDRGMFSPGLCPAGITQEERAPAFVRHLQGALVHPQVVGAHWSQFRDQPLTGRWDGGGYAIGFVDVADTPYVAMTRAAREVGESMYRYRPAGALTNSMAP